MSFHKRENYNIVLSDDLSYISNSLGVLSNDDEKSLDRFIGDFNEDSCFICTYFNQEGYQLKEDFCKLDKCKKTLVMDEVTSESLGSIVRSLFTKFQHIDIKSIPLFVSEFEDQDDFIVSGLQLIEPEYFLYRYISEGWREICYFYLRGFSQVVISSFMGYAQTLVSYLQKRLFVRLKILDGAVVPLLVKLCKAEKILLKIFSFDDIEIIKLSLIRTSASYVSKFYPYSTSVIKMRVEHFQKMFECPESLSRTYYELSRLSLLNSIEFNICKDLVKDMREHFKWNLIGRDPDVKGKIEVTKPNVRHVSSRYRKLYNR